MSWRRIWQHTLVCLPGKSHGWRRLVGYSTWGSKESSMTERLSLHTHAVTGMLSGLTHLHSLSFSRYYLIKESVENWRGAPPEWGISLAYIPVARIQAEGHFFLNQGDRCWDKWLCWVVGTCRCEMNMTLSLLQRGRQSFCLPAMLWQLHVRTHIQHFEHGNSHSKPDTRHILP